MSQSKRASIIEALVNTFFGFVLSYAMQRVLAYAYDVPMSHAVTFWFVFWFTVLSVVRNYVIRRVANSEFWKYRKCRKNGHLPISCVSGPILCEICSQRIDFDEGVAKEWKQEQQKLFNTTGML